MRKRASGVVVTAIAAMLAIVLTACSASAPTAAGTVAFIPNYTGGGTTEASAPVQGYSSPIPVVSVDLADTSPDQMAITLGQSFAPTGKVSFLVTNSGTVTHEFVVLQTDTPAAGYPIVSFEGEANRINEDAKGTTNVGETGDMEPGAVMMLTLDLASAHYAVVCNLVGHYAAGMHEDFWVTPEAFTVVFG